MNRATPLHTTIDPAASEGGDAAQGTGVCSSIRHVNKTGPNWSASVTRGSSVADAPARKAVLCM